MRIIKLMADYQCFPLWEASPGQVGNIDPESLSISQELKTQLMEWAQAYDSTLNMDDPTRSGFLNEEDEAAFIRTGHEISDRLRNELGSGFTLITKI